MKIFGVISNEKDLRLEDIDGNYLKEAREGRGLTVSDLAKKTGLLKLQIKRFESNKLKPRHDDFLKINEILQMPYKFYARPYKKKKKGLMFICKISSGGN